MITKPTKEEILEIIKNNRCNFTRVIKKKFILFYNEINLLDGDKFSEKLYKWMNGIGLCKNCNKPTKFIDIKTGYREFCSNNCVNKSTIIKERIKNGFLEKYGVDNVSKSEEIKLKKKQVFNDKYGSNISCPFNFQHVKDKSKIEWEKYFENNRDDILTNLNKKRKESFINDCLCGIRLSDTIEPLFDINTFTNIKDYNLMFRCKVCNNTFHHHLQWGNKPHCWKCNPNSNFQNEVSDFILKKGIEIKQNVRNIIDGELDIFMPSLNIAIECNGVYWHSIDKKSKTYHINKTIACEKLGIKLIHIFENEWETDYIKNLLSIILKNDSNDILNLILCDNIQNEYYLLNRRFFNKCFLNENFTILEEIDPTIDDFGGYLAWNCGYLKLKKL